MKKQNAELTEINEEKYANKIKYVIKKKLNQERKMKMRLKEAEMKEW